MKRRTFVLLDGVVYMHRKFLVVVLEVESDMPNFWLGTNWLICL